MNETDSERANRLLREEAALLREMTTGKRKASLADIGSQCGRVLRSLSRIMRRPWEGDDDGHT